MNARVAYANVYVTDLERAVEFYGGPLGLSLLFRHDEFRYARFSAGPIEIGLAGVEEAVNPELVGRQTGIGFAVPDIDEAYEELRAKGVEFPMVPCDQPWGGRLALFSDPDGNTFYLDRTGDGGR